MKKLSMVTLLTMISTISFAQADQLPEPKPYFSAVIVGDMDVSLNWYTKNLGFEILNQVDMAARGFKQANLKRGNALLELIELNSALSQSELLANQPPGSRIQGFFKIGFLVSSLDNWVDFLTEAGVEFNGSVVEDPNTGQRMVIIKDPDGNRIQLFEG